MIIKYIFYFIVSCFALSCSLTNVHAQHPSLPSVELEKAEIELATAAMENKALDRGVDITFSGSLKDFSIIFSKETGVNLVVDPSLVQQVAVSFSDTKPRDILLHIVSFYKVGLEANSSIISLFPRIQKTKSYVPKEPEIEYIAKANQLSLNLSADTLDFVVASLTRLMDTSVVADQTAGNLEVSGFVRASGLKSTLKQLAKRNGLSVQFDTDIEAYVLSKIAAESVNTEVQQQNSSSPNQRSRSRSRNVSTAKTNRQGGNDGQSVIGVSDSTGTLLNVDVTNFGLQELVEKAARITSSSFLFLAPIDEEVTLEAKGVSFDELLELTLPSAGQGVRKERDTYLVGPTGDVSLQHTEVITLMHRSAKDLIESLPSELLSGVEVKEFLQLNALVCSGSSEKVQAVKSFLESIDVAVPVVMIELLIVDVQKNTEVSTGVEVGRADQPVAAQGKIFPEVDLTLSSKSLNDLLDLLAGNGVINLGAVDPNFYARIQAAENNGFARVHSKPRLSTVNGQEASLSLGETRYYSVQRTTLAGNLNPVTLQDRTFESVNANFTINILPIVAGNGGVTLEIDVSQSDFLGRFQTDAPPAQVNREFTSLIRMQDGEMIVLGGLESKSVNDSGSGVPLLSRIPVLKWIFSSRNKSRNSSRLLIFVKPIVIY